jgi:hypothetical protein
MKDFWSHPRPFWPAVILTTETVYVLAFLRPYGLLDHYASPQMDLGRLSGYSVEAGWGFLLAMGLLFLLYAAAFRRAGTADQAPLRWIVGGGLLFALTAAAVYPVGALDVFDNLFYGRMAAFYGANPLLAAPDAFPSDLLYPYAAWTWWPIPYGPIWAAVDALLSRISNGELLPGLIAFKALNLGVYAACTGLIAVILARTRPGYVAAGTLLFAWNPLVLLEGLASVHNDLGLMVLVLLAFHLHQRGRSLWALAALLASVLVKFVSLAATPLFLVAGWRTSRDRGRYVLGAGALLALSAVMLYLPYYTPGQSWEQLALRPFHQADLFTTSLPAVLSFWLEGTVARTEAQSLARNLALTGWVIFSIWQTWRLWRAPAAQEGAGSVTPLAERAYAVLLYFLLFACLWFQPWYLVWLLALAPLLGRSPHAAAVICFSALVQIKYFIFDFAWLWRTPVDDILAPEVATTVAIFVPMLLVYALVVCWRRRKREGTKGAWGSW